LPADIQTKEGKTDYLFLEKFAESCPRAADLAKMNMNIKNNQYLNLVQPTIKKLKDAGFSAKEIFSTDDWNIPLITQLYDVFRGNLWYYGNHYENVTDDLYREMELIHSFNFNYKLFSNDKGRTLWTHSIISNLLDIFKNKIDGKVKDFEDLNYVMYSAHDDNMVPFMTVFNLTSVECAVEKYRQYINPTSNSSSNSMNSNSGDSPNES
jgi:hypothetical protein